MVRSIVLLGILTAFGQSAQDPPAKPPAEEYQDRLARIKLTLADEHHKVGEYLNGVSMHRWARDEYRKAIGFNPDHAEARKKLGYTQKDGEWEPDPSIAMETENKKKGDEAGKLKQEYDKKIEKLGKTLARQWSDLGSFCEKNKLKAESEAAYKKALEYDPTNNESRKKLGYVRQGKGGPWLSKFETDFRKKLKEGAGKYPDGSPVKEESQVEQDLGWKLDKRQSPHFVIEAPAKGQDWLKDQNRHGEFVYAMFHKYFDLKEDLWQQPMNVIVVRGRDEHESYIGKYHQGDAASRDHAKKSGGFGGFPRQEMILDKREDIKDFLTHYTAQHLMNHMVGGQRIWIDEGMAFHFAVMLDAKQGWYCTNIGGTGAGETARDYTKQEDWPLIIRTLVNEGKDSTMLEVFKCRGFAEMSGAKSVKAWSMIEFMMVEHRERFMEFLSKVRGQKEEDDEKALMEVFGWTLDDFDIRWKTYVRASN